MAEYKTNTHIAIKLEDIRKYLTVKEISQLVDILVNISSGRRADGKKPENTYYICNTDEPYAEEVLNVILENNNCEDFINRQDLLDKILRRMQINTTQKNFEENTGLAIAQGYIIGMHRAKGKWIVEIDCEGKTRTCTCNLCGNKTSKYTWVNPNFCSNCGAKMENGGDKE